MKPKIKDIILFILFLILIGYLTRKSIKESQDYEEYENEMLRVQDSIWNAENDSLNFEQ